MPQYSQFNRKCSVLIGKANATTAIRVDDLRIVFHVKKTRSTTPNSLKLDIYNLSKDSRESISLSGNKVIVNAGYADETSQFTIFKGDILRVYHEKKPPNIVTVIEALDGLKATSTKVSVGYPKQTDTVKIVRDIAKTAGIPVEIPETVINKLYPNGFSVQGKVKEALDKITAYMGAEWSSQDETIKIIPLGKGDNNEVFQISAKYGMLESPIKIANATMGAIKLPTKKKDSGNIDVFPGWKVKNLLIPKLVPGNRVTIESENVPANSVFYIWGVEHNGDTWGDNWCSEIEVSQSSKSFG